VFVLGIESKAARLMKLERKYLLDFYPKADSFLFWMTFNRMGLPRFFGQWI